MILINYDMKMEQRGYKLKISILPDRVFSAHIEGVEPMLNDQVRCTKCSKCLLCLCMPMSIEIC